MNRRFLPLLACLSLLSACASKDAAYRDANGRPADGAQPYAERKVTVAVAPASTSPAPTTPPAAVSAPKTAPWPRVFRAENVTNTVYQPEIDSWDGFSVSARTAVGVQTSERAKALYGVVSFRAKALVDKSERKVTLHGIELVKADFPSAADKADEYLQLLKKGFPKDLTDVSLEALESSFAANEQRLKGFAQRVNNTPPKIIFTTAPAVLVSIDGEPALRPVKGTSLERVINTRVLLLKDNQARPTYYLHMLGGYMQSPTLEGGWARGNPPPGADLVEKEVSNDAAPPDLLDAQSDTEAPAGGQRMFPEIYVSTTPAELITFDGQPDYTPIPGTKLLYVNNTTANVFKLLSDQQTYVLAAGRWFRSSELNGPWEFVSGGQLPPDFAQIPDSSPKENVKASVPGTQQAREALIANSIPQTSSISRTNQMADPGFDGAPRLAAIEGTPLQYVMNSATPIIRVDEQSWYACQKGVWYAATSVAGPWTVATSVPAVIYSIPASSPMHYVTYVRVYDANSDVVYQGYTPGYMGTVVSPDYVVVYGTGYYYRPWVGSVWYSPPMTWGYGGGVYWAPWSGWSYGFGFGWYAGYGGWYPYGWYPYPYWGPYYYYPHHLHYSYNGRDYGYRPNPHTSADLYRTTSPRAAYLNQANRSTPTRTYGRAYNSRTGDIVAGDRAPVRNVFRTSASQSAGQRATVSGQSTTGVTRPGWGTPVPGDPSQAGRAPSRATSGTSRSGRPAGQTATAPSSPRPSRDNADVGPTPSGPRFSPPSGGGGSAGGGPAPSSGPPPSSGSGGRGGRGGR